MKIWRCDCYDENLGTLVSWHPSRREATNALLAFQKERGEPAVGPECVEQIDIPTNKKGLLEWLNANFSTDNG